MTGADGGADSGKLVRIEHASAAASRGATNLGIGASNRIVIANEKRPSSILVDCSVIERVAAICPNIGIVYSGVGPNFRVLVARARKSAHAYWKMYGEHLPTKVLTQDLANIMERTTHSGGVQPFGVSLLAPSKSKQRVGPYPMVNGLPKCKPLSATRSKRMADLREPRGCPVDDETEDDIPSENGGGGSEPPGYEQEKEPADLEFHPTPDEILSEDDGRDWEPSGYEQEKGPADLEFRSTRDEMLSEDEGGGWEPPEYEQEKEPAGFEFHPTPNDIEHVRAMFPLPPELATLILEHAEYWAFSRVTRSDSVHFRHANVRYLRTPPIQGGGLTHPLRRVVVTTDSKDQGWSRHPETQGTREGSWTWFELTLDDGETGDEIVRVEVVRNVHAGLRFENHRAVIEDERVLKQAKEGDRLSVWVRAMRPGWENWVQSVTIEAWSAY